MIFLYLAGVVTSMIYEYYTFSKISKQLEKDGYTLTDDFNYESGSSLLLLASCFTIIPFVNIVLPLVLLNKYDRVYDVAVDTLEKCNYIKKEDTSSNTVDTKTAIGTSSETKSKDKKFKDLSRREKIEFLEDLRREFDGQSRDQERSFEPKVKRYKK